MPKYRKKPVAINAIQITPTLQISEILEAFDGAQPIRDVEKLTVRNDELLDAVGYRTAYINTVEAEMFVFIGDYIIQGVEGEFYPCKESVFKATYEKVEEE